MMHLVVALLGIAAVAFGVYPRAVRQAISACLDAACTSLQPYGCCSGKFTTFHELLEHIAEHHRVKITLPFAATEHVTFTAMPVVGSHACCATRLNTLDGLFNHIVQVHHTRITRWAGHDKQNFVDYRRLATTKKSNGGMKPVIWRQPAITWKVGMALQDFFAED